MNLKGNDERKKPNTQIPIALFLYMYKSNRQSKFIVTETGKVLSFGGILTRKGHKGSYVFMWLHGPNIHVKVAMINVLYVSYTSIKT